MRIDLYLSMALGISRREAAVLIKSGVVLIDGNTTAKKDVRVPIGGKVIVNGRDVAAREHIHLMMNKPAGYLTAVRDRSAPTVMEFVDPVYIKRGVSPVGRLDKDVAGLLLFTTDGELNHRLTSPARGISKVYIVTVNGVLTSEDVVAFQSGLRLHDFDAKPARLEIIGENVGRLSITEGKFHQVKRMFAAVGKPVEALRRESVAGIMLDTSLEPGQVRELTEDEMSALYVAVGMGQLEGKSK